MRKSLILIGLTLALIAPSGASASLGDLFVVSRADGPAGALGDGNSSSSSRSTSADGRYVVFSTYAQNLGGPVTAGRNIYRRDTLLGRTELVSRATGLTGTAGDDNSFGASVSADGDRIAFVSNADNLSTADNNTYANIFVRDMIAGTTTLASRASGVSGAAANNTSLIPTISGDGNTVGFQSQATNLDPTVTDNNSQVDVFVRDLTDSTTRLLSKSTGGTLGNGLTTIGDISYDGNMVTMDTEGTSLGGTVAPGSYNVYVRYRNVGSTVLISQPSGESNVSGTGLSGGSTITDSGDRIAFTSDSANFALDAPASRQEAYIRDLSSKTTTMVSRSAAGQPADADIYATAISSDGSFMTLDTAATNLDGPTNALRQIFTRDLGSGVTTLVSRAGRDGPIGDRASTYPTPGRSSKFVLFETNSTNLAPDANGTKYHLFMRDAKVVDPIPAITISGKRFNARLSKKSFTVKATTSGGATRISGKATLRVSKRIVKSGKIVVKLKTRTVASTLTSHKLRFTLSKKQNRRVLKALKKKSSRVKLTVSLTATGAGTPGTAKISGKLRR